MANDADALREELAVHEAELATQNEELLETRARLEEALAGFTELFELAPIGYAVLDELGTIKQLNRAAATLFGWPASTMLDRTFGAFVAAPGLAAFRALLLDGGMAELELACRAEQRIARLHVGRARYGTLVAFEDVTLAKREAVALAQSEAALREANARKDEFLAMLSHELRNPLAPIQSAVTVMKLAPGSEESREAQDIIERSVVHLRRLVDDLLDITRISHGKIELRKVPVDVVATMRRVVEDHAGSFKRRGIALDTELPAHPLWATGDPVRLVQVIANLVGNAEKFTPGGGRVAVRVEAAPGAAVIRIRDTGIGIEPAQIASLFEPFAQVAQGLARARGGLGLGLAVARSIVELHGGDVQMRSDGLGRGTEVSVALPAAGAPTSTERQVGDPLPPRRVLIIEDNPDASVALARMLALYGHDVHTAANGLAGLAAARTFVPEVVLCDLGLPGLDGFGVARAMRADADLRDATLVAVSGYARPEDIARARAAGFDSHLAKPISADSLATVLAARPR